VNRQSPVRCQTTPFPSFTIKRSDRVERSCLGKCLGDASEVALTYSSSEIKMMGVTPPISTDPPKASDVQASESKLTKSHLELS
jgi:hypothetical protein